MTLIEALARFGGAPIRRCPGRYVLRGVPATAGPETMVEQATPVSRYQVPTARDTVAVAWLGEWGLISYARRDGSWLHTANTHDGFVRKLAELGLDVPSTGAGAANPDRS